jgi:dTDP-glucose 4,6-dehydratase
VRADVGNYRQLKAAFEAVEPDYVYHMAAEFGRENGEKFYEQVWQTNAVGTRNVLELCNLYRARMFFASSSEAYGEIPEDLLVEELLTSRAPMLQNEYAISKYTNELQVRNHVARYDTDANIFRFFNAYGPGEKYTPYRSVVALFCYRALHGMRFDVYEGYHRTFMHVDDFIPTLANAVERADKKDFPFVVNIGGVDYRSVEELALIVLDAVGADDNIVRLLKAEEHNVVNKRPSIVLAKQYLGHDPKILLEGGVPQTVEWMRKEYAL